jgi:hypothetical protein
MNHKGFKTDLDIHTQLKIFKDSSIIGSNNNSNQGIWTKAKEAGKDNITIEEIKEEIEEEVTTTGEEAEVNIEINKTRTILKISNKDQTISNNLVNLIRNPLLKLACLNHLSSNKLIFKLICNSLRLMFQFLTVCKGKTEKISLEITFIK